MEIGSYFWAAQSRATLPHQCPDRDRLSARVYLLVSAFHPVVIERSWGGGGGRRGDAGKRRIGCSTAANLELEKEGEEERRDCFCLVFLFFFKLVLFPALHLPFFGREEQSDPFSYPSRSVSFGELRNRLQETPEVGLFLLFRHLRPFKIVICAVWIQE